MFGDLSGVVDGLGGDVGEVVADDLPFVVDIDRDRGRQRRTLAGLGSPGPVRGNSEIPPAAWDLPGSRINAASPAPVTNAPTVRKPPSLHQFLSVPCGTVAVMRDSDRHAASTSTAGLQSSVDATRCECDMRHIYSPYE